MSERVKPYVLVVLDGWGYSETEQDNAISAAKTPVWDRLWQTQPHALIHGSGTHVGLPGGQMGNSEVGHLNLGAGRVIHQELTRIGGAIDSGAFNENQTLNQACQKAVEHDRAIHIMGLLSDGGIHSHNRYVQAMVALAHQRGVKKIYIHAFLDGRDTPPRSAEKYLQTLQDALPGDVDARIVSLIGRYYAMDRDRRWDRMEMAYNLIVKGQAEYRADNPLAGLQAAYERDESDEFVKATCIVDEQGQACPIEDGDVVVFMNFRADRARQLTEMLSAAEFDGFDRGERPSLSDMVTLTEFHKDFDVNVAYPPEEIHNSLGEYISQLGMQQLRIAETEKYAHVTFFFNGGREQAFEGEDRVLVESPKIATDDLQPEMSADEVTDRLLEAIQSGKYSLVICNYANPDMVGHTGNLDAATKAIEAIDRCLGRLEQGLKEAGGEMVITADHGNAEKMRDDTSGQAHTAHTSNPVPFIYIGRDAETCSDESWALSDIAPTMLYMMGLEAPAEMTGRSIIRFT